MDYLDYLADYIYDELPQAVRTTISREDYAARRQMVLAVQEPEETTLPPELAAAFVAHTSVRARPQEAMKVESSRVRWLPWLAAAGWLLFLGVSGLLLLQEPETLLVETPPSGDAAEQQVGAIAPAVAPKIIHTTDTLYQTITRYRDRVETVYDTVYEQVPYEQLVYVRDTVFLRPIPKETLVKGSSSLSGKERVLSFLFATE